MKSGFGGKGYKMFGLDGNNSDSRWIFFIEGGDNNYSISTTVFGFNPKLSL